MKIEKIKTNNGQEFNDSFLISPNIFKDDRGFFFESWNQKYYDKLFGKKIFFVQDNHSMSSIGVLRGLHFQIAPKVQGKLIRVLSGSIFDVIVDLRINSLTYLNWGGVELNACKKQSLWVPPGFAHGFLSLEENTEVNYKVTDFWDCKLEKTLRWDDKYLDIKWPLSNINIDQPIMSSKDEDGKSLREIEIFQ